MKLSTSSSELLLTGTSWKITVVAAVTAFSSAVGRVLQGAASHTKTARAKMFVVSF